MPLSLSVVVTQYQRLKRVSHFHAIQYSSTEHMLLASVGTVTNQQYFT